MDVRSINSCLLRGDLEAPGLFPHLEQLERAPVRFDVSFGLDRLPEQAGVLFVRGARQLGKSTWLEECVRETVTTYGPATAAYLNGDELARAADLVAAIRDVVPLLRADAPVRRLFVDEITAVPEWTRGLKRLLDAGELRDVLVVTTGSSARDLRRGSERLPGRKGRLARTSFVFTPLSYAAFVAQARQALGDDCPIAYLLSGGCPVAAGELVSTGRLPEWVIEIVRDWVLGECARDGRDRGSLVAVWDAILERGGTPIGQAGLARAAGLANNTVAAGYLELLADIGCVATSRAIDSSRFVAVRRRPAKLPPTNLLAAVAFDRARLRAPEDFLALPPETQGRWWEWLVAQELWRRAAVRGDEAPDELRHWRSKDRELDFVVDRRHLIEVKRGRQDPMEFSWFPQVFPGARLTIVGRDRFEAGPLHGVTMEDFLLDT